MRTHDRDIPVSRRRSQGHVLHVTPWQGPRVWVPAMRTRSRGCARVRDICAGSRCGGTDGGVHRVVAVIGYASRLPVRMGGVLVWLWKRVHGAGGIRGGQSPTARNRKDPTLLASPHAWPGNLAEHPSSSPLRPLPPLLSLSRSRYKFTINCGGWPSRYPELPLLASRHKHLTLIQSIHQLFTSSWSRMIY